MNMRLIHANTEWTQYCVQVWVPPSAVGIIAGGSLKEKGKGNAWFDDFRMTVVRDGISTEPMDLRSEAYLLDAIRIMEQKSIVISADDPLRN